MSAETKTRVVGIGLSCLDQLLIWKNTAVPVQENSVVDADMQGGGMAATAMVTVRRLGAEAELWSAVGDDWVGDEIVRGLEAEGVDTTNVVRTLGGRSLFMVVCVDEQTGERHFMRASDWDRPSEVIGPPSRLANSGCLLIDHALPQTELAAAKEARRLGVPVVSDTERFNEWHPEILPYVDYAIVSERGARMLEPDLHQACRTIRRMGAKNVVITLGASGLIFLEDDTPGSLPAFAVDVVDTTGAGDVFHGAFCYGLVHHWSLQENLLFASATSALKCGKIGGRAGIPTRDQVDAFLAQRSSPAELP